jgi:hypothetical protein
MAVMAAMAAIPELLAVTAEVEVMVAFLVAVVVSL